jgi:hypothetical protein
MAERVRPAPHIDSIAANGVRFEGLKMKPKAKEKDDSAEDP